MPAKKKTAAKKAAKGNAVSKKKAIKKAPAKKTVKKAAPKKTIVKKKAVRKAAPVIEIKEIQPAAELQPEPIVIKEPEKPKKQGIPCDHCDATGVCAAGSPYDKTHGRMFGAQVRITSCIECLTAVGEHKNSKKLVKCRVCGGDGEI